jgi:hypothetical protein
MSESELDIARRIAAGTAPSPTVMPEFTWVAVRFTGTGTAWRGGMAEHVFRPPEIFLAPDMIARVAGVPLVWLHPAKGLDSEAFEQTVIGTLAFGYVATPDGFADEGGPELWAMARVYDATALAEMQGRPISTSPAVTFFADQNETLPLQDGTHVLIESRPATISHLAIVPAGVWDKGGAVPLGIRIDNLSREPTMTTETARNDADSAGNIDKVLSYLDAMSKRLDALEQPMSDARRRADAAKARRDAERAEWMKADAAMCARDDADEESETKELMAQGEPEEVAADRARTNRRDRMDKRRADAQAEIRHGTPMARNDAADREAMEARAAARIRADSVYGSFGEEAPAPWSNESPLAYRRRLLRPLLRHSATFKGADVYAVNDAATFDGIEKTVYADALTASKTPEVPAGQMIKRTNVDPETGHRVTTFYSNETIFKRFSAPSQRVTRFNIPQHRQSA